MFWIEFYLEGEKLKAKYFYDSPIGILCMEEENGKITALQLEYPKQKDEQSDFILQKWNLPWKETELLHEANRQLQEYFCRKRKKFELPLYMEGTEFQKKVWGALCQIPYGETRSYGEIAKMIGNPKASRAVGGANHRNPIMILIPCHRVIGATGALVGFGGGLPAKEYLLKLEKGGN